MLAVLAQLDSSGIHVHCDAFGAEEVKAARGGPRQPQSLPQAALCDGEVANAEWVQQCQACF